MIYKIKKGDTWPPIKGQLTRNNDVPIDISDSALYFKLEDINGNVYLDNSAEIVDGPQGKVKYTWQPGDTDKIGVYKAYFYVLFDDGAKVTVPNVGTFDLKIIE